MDDTRQLGCSKNKILISTPHLHSWTSSCLQITIQRAKLIDAFGIFKIHRNKNCQFTCWRWNDFLLGTLGRGRRLVKENNCEHLQKSGSVWPRPEELNFFIVMTAGKEVVRRSQEQDEGGDCFRRKQQRQRDKHGLWLWSLGSAWNMVCYKGNKG